MPSQSYKLHALSRVAPRQPKPIDTVKAERRANPQGRSLDILRQAEQCWNAMERFRADRERAKRYLYGDQWGDPICVDGKTMTEEQYLMSQGRVPLKNNLMRRLTKTVIGLWRSQNNEPTCVARDRDEQQLAETMSTVLQCNMQLNRRSEVDARTLEEFLISGMAVQRKTYGWRNGRMDCWTDYVQPANFFVDADCRDFRLWDVSVVGEIHDIPFRQLAARFSSSPSEYSRLSEIYAECRDYDALYSSWRDFGYSREAVRGFFWPSSPGLCRVIEVWRRETRPRYRCHDFNNGSYFKVEASDLEETVGKVNAERLARAQAQGMAPEEVPLIEAEWFVDDLWYFYYLSPMGDILAEGETPYRHGSHPYVMLAYPFIDGELHSFVGDFIDQQRFVNRLITTHDWLVQTSAKGLLMVPQQCLPPGTDLSEFAETWTKVGGVVLIDAKPGVPMPQEISNNSTNVGIQELLGLELKLFEEVSGVQSALQGKPGNSGMPAALYAQQTQNATLSLLDIMEAFSSFIRDGAYKDVKNIQQFYDSKRMFNIAGKSGAVAVYDPTKISDVEFDLAIVQSTQTPVHRAVSNDLLMQIWQSGQISIEDMLQVGAFPFSDQLLQVIKTRKEQQEQAAQQAQAAGQQPPMPQQPQGPQPQA